MQNGESSLLVTTSSSSVALIDWQAEKKANARELTLKHKTSQSRQPITVWCGRRTHKKGRYITANQSGLYPSPSASLKLKVFPQCSTNIFDIGQVILYDDTLKVLSTESAGEHPILSVDCHPQREGTLSHCEAFTRYSLYLLFMRTHWLHTLGLLATCSLDKQVRVLSISSSH